MKCSFILWVVTCITVLLIAGCVRMNQVSTSNRQNLLSVSLGMTREEVTLLMGRKICATYDKKPMAVEGKDPYAADLCLVFRRTFSTVSNPYKTNYMSINGAFYAIDYYLTGNVANGNEVGNEQLTPLVFNQKNILVGWGWIYMNELFACSNTNQQHGDKEATYALSEM